MKTQNQIETQVETLEVETLEETQVETPETLESLEAERASLPALFSAAAATGDRAQLLKLQERGAQLPTLIDVMRIAQIEADIVNLQTKKENLNTEWKEINTAFITAEKEFEEAEKKKLSLQGDLSSCSMDRRDADYSINEKRRELAHAIDAQKAALLGSVQIGQTSPFKPFSFT